MNTRDDTIRVIADEAFDAFWKVVVGRFPEATTGDLSPWTTIRLQLIGEEAIAEWVGNNVPSSATSRFTTDPD